jgi:uncharacterized membrane protein
MTIVVIMKFFHYISLFLAGGLGVANVMLFKNHQKAGIPPAPPVQKTMMALARLGLVAILALWITGFLLIHQLYGSFTLGIAFHFKMLGAAILLGTVAFLNIHLTIRARQNIPPHSTVMKLVPPITRGALVLVLVSVAVLTTSA